MRPLSRLTSIAVLVVGVAIFATACSAAATPSAAVAGATNTAAAAVMTPAPTDTTAPAATAVDSAAGGTVAIGSTADATLGAYLTGQDGMTLYVFKSDKADSSNCSGTCATNWPPLTAPAGAPIIPPSAATAAFGMINRSDGTIQVTYNHMPLYYFAGDSAAGDTNGQGTNNLWYVAPVSGSLSGVPTAPSGY